MLRFISVGTILFLSFQAGAQAPLAWSDVLAKAYNQNAEIKSLKNQREAVSYQKDAAKSDFLPSVYLFADKSRNEREVSLLKTDSESESYGLRANWNLFNGFGTYNTVRKVSYVENQVMAQIQERKAELRYNLRRSMFRLLISKRAIETWKKLVSLQEKQFSVVQIKYRSGVEALWSVEMSRANVELTKSTLAMEEENYRAAVSEVEALLNEPLPADVTWVDDLNLYLQGDIDIELSENHPRLFALRQQVAEARADSAIIKAGYLPTVSANFQLGRSKFNDEEVVQNNQVGVSVTLALFEGFSTTNRNSQARAVALAREFSLQDTRGHLEKNIKSSKSSFDVNRKVLTAKQIEVKASNLWSSTVDKQYRLGVRTYSDWDQAQTKMINSEREYLQILRDTLESRINLERLLAVTEEL